MRAIKLAILLAVSLVCSNAKAQFDESTYIVNASVTGLNISYNETEKLNAEVDISAGSFVMDNFAILGNIGSKFNNNGNQKFYIGAESISEQDSNTII